MTSSAPPSTLLSGLTFGAGAGALWGLVFLAPALIHSFSPMELATGRYLAYGLMALPLLAPRFKTLQKHLTRRDWASLFWLSLSGNILYYILLAAAVQLQGIAPTSLIISFLPIAITLIGSRDENAVPLRTLIPSLLFCTAAALCIGWQTFTIHHTSAHPLIGPLCAIGALITWTAYAIRNSRCLNRLHHISAHDWSLLTGLVTGLQALVLLPFAFLFNTTPHSPTDWTAFLTISAGIAFLASICGNAFWNRMSRLLPLALTGQMVLFETLFALIYAFLWEHRLPHPQEIIAFTMITLALLTCLSAHRRHKQPEAPATPARNPAAPPHSP